MPLSEEEIKEFNLRQIPEYVAYERLMSQLSGLETKNLSSDNLEAKFAKELSTTLDKLFVENAEKLKDAKMRESVGVETIIHHGINGVENQLINATKAIKSLKDSFKTHGGFDNDKILSNLIESSRKEFHPANHPQLKETKSNHVDPEQVKIHLNNPETPRRRRSGPS